MWKWLQSLFPPPAPSVHPLVILLRGPEPETRRQAAVLLGEVAEPWAATELVEALRDAHSIVREAVRESLLHHESAADALRKGLDHADTEVARQSAELLGELRPPDAIEPLLLALKYSARPVQLAARRALARYGAAAVPALEAVGDEPQPWVRQQIAELLAELRQDTPPP